MIIAFSTDSHEQSLEVIHSVQDAEVQIDIVPRLFEVLGTNTQLHAIEGVQLVSLPRHASLDLVPLPQESRSTSSVPTLGLVLLTPLFVAAAMWIKLDSRGPVFFRQVRMGEDERKFRIFKFRTMIHNADERKTAVAHLNMHRDGDPRMFKVPNDPRVTRAGAFLRRWRIDELPQLFNVIRGEMSLVGPRPLDPRRGPVRREAGTEAARSQARNDGSLAGARCQRHPLRRDDEARLPVRHELVAPRGPAVDPAHGPVFGAVALRVLAAPRTSPSSPGASLRAPRGLPG